MYRNAQRHNIWPYVCALYKSSTLSSSAFPTSMLLSDHVIDKTIVLAHGMLDCKVKLTIILIFSLHFQFSHYKFSHHKILFFFISGFSHYKFSHYKISITIEKKLTTNFLQRSLRKLYIMQIIKFRSIYRTPLSLNLKFL